MSDQQSPSPHEPQPLPPAVYYPPAPPPGQPYMPAPPYQQASPQYMPRALQYPPYAPPQQVLVVQQQAIPRRNGAAVAALVLGLVGFFFTDIPFFIGFVTGGIPDILAIIFAIVALSRTTALGGVGRAPAVWGLVLGGLGFLSMFLGAGSIW